MSSEFPPEVIAGQTTYVHTKIDGKPCYVARGYDNDPAFTFLCKTDRESKGNIFVNFVSRAKYSTLPDVSNLDEPEPLEATINAGGSTYQSFELDEQHAYYPVSMGQDAPRRFMWYAKLDRLNSRHFFVNVETKAKVWMLPEIADHRLRVIAMLKRYAPADADRADEINDAQYGGQWPPHLKALVDKHGEEPATIRRDARERLMAIFSKYAPQEISHIEAWLDQHDGKEADLIASLRSQYGAEPPTYRQRIAAIYEKYNPEKLSSVDDGLRMYAGKELMLIAALVKKYGPEPLAEAAGTSAGREKSPEELAEFRLRVVAMYTKYNPSKLDSVDQGLAMYKNQEELLMEALVTKYGPEPTGETPEGAATGHPEPVPASSGASATFLPDFASATDDASAVDAGGTPVSQGLTPAELNDYRRRAEAILRKYKPNKLSTVEELLAKYVGQEAFLIEALINKYGPEPVETPRGGSNAAVEVAVIAPAALQPIAPAPAPADQPMAMAAAAEAEEEDPLVQQAKADTRHSSAKSYEERVTAIYAQYAPQAIRKASKALAMYEDKEQLIEALVSKYGLEPQFGNAESGQVVHVDPSASPVAVDEPQVDGGEVPPPAEETAPATAVEVAPAQQAEVPAAAVEAAAAKPLAAGDDFEAIITAAFNDTRPPHLKTLEERVTAIYAYYAPESMHKVRNALERFSDREDALIDALVDKYGPEPHFADEEEDLEGEGDAAPDEVPGQSDPVTQLQVEPTAAVAEPSATVAVASEVVSNDPIVNDETPAAQPPAATAAVEDGQAIQSPSDMEAPRETEPPSEAAAVDVRTDEIASDLSTVQQVTEVPAPAPAAAVVAPAPAPAAAVVETAAVEAPAAADDLASNDAASTIAHEPLSLQRDKGTYRERVMRFYLHYKPKKASDALVDRALAMYAGQEEQLIEELVSKFGPEPPADAVLLPASSAPDALSFDASTDPEAIPASLVGTFAGMVRSAVASDQLYGTMMIRKLMMSSDPPANAVVDQHLLDCLVEHMKQGANHKELASEAAWLVTLIAFASAPHDSLNMTKGTTCMLTYAERILALYQRYDPESIPKLPSMLQRYAGQESLLVEILVRRHGPEDNSAQQRQQVEALVATHCANMPAARVAAALNKFAGFEDVLAAALRIRHEGVEAHQESSTRHTPWSEGGDVLRTPAGISTATTPTVSPREDAESARRRQEQLVQMLQAHASERANAEDAAHEAKETTALAESQQRNRLVAEFSARTAEVVRLEVQRRFERDALALFDSEDSMRRSFLDEEYAHRLMMKQHFSSSAPAERREQKIEAETPAQQQQTAAAPAAAAVVVTVAPQPEATAPTAEPTPTSSPMRASSTSGHATAAATPAAADPTPVREVRRAIQEATMLIEADPATIAARDAHHLSIVGALATFEVRLREAYDKLSSAVVSSESLREENCRLANQLATVRTDSAAQVDQAREQLEEARKAARDLEREAEFAKASIKNDITVSTIAAQHELETERLRAEEFKLEHARAVRVLYDEINGLQDKKRESEVHSMHLTHRLASVTRELEEANNAVELLTQQLQSRVRILTTTSTQYDAQDCAAPSPAVDNGGLTPGRYSETPLREQRMQVVRLAAEVEEWKSLANRLKTELRTAERQHRELVNAPCEECDTATIVIAKLRDRNMQLEADLQRLEMIFAAGPESNALYPSRNDDHELRREVVRLKQMLADATATARSQRNEIQDLRGLLAIHMASPAAKRRGPM